MLKITKGKLLQDDLTSSSRSWRHLQYWNMKSFLRIRAIHISTINCWHILFIAFVICLSVVCVAVFTSCQKLCFIGFFVAFYCIPFLLII